MHGLCASALRKLSRSNAVAFALTCAASLPAFACGGAGGSFDAGVFRKGPIAFHIGPVPAGWRRVEVDSASLAFRDDAHEASILVNARCSKTDAATPLVALTNHLLIGSTEREIVSQRTEPFDGREVMRTEVRAKWDGVPTALDIFVLKKDGCTYDFVFTTEPSRFAGGAAGFESFVRSFRTLEGSGVVG